MTRRVVRPLNVSPKALGVAMVVLAAATELKFRERDATLALETVIDAQIVAELAVWGLVFAWLIAIALRRRRNILSPFLPIGLHGSLRIAVVIAVMALLWSVQAPSALSVARAVQFAAMTTLAVVTFHRVRGNTELTLQYWRAFRRAVWVVVLLAVAGTAVLYGPLPAEFEGETRYTWFSMHPITTANIIGIAVILAGGAVFHVREELLARPWFRFGAGTLAAITTVLLLLSKARGAIAATVIGVAVVIALSRRRGLKLAAMLMVMAGVAFLLAGIGDDAVIGALRRGATANQLRTLSGRTELFGFAYELFLQKPVFGHGFLAGRSVFLESVPWAGEAHNLLVEIAISFGIIGVLVYGALALRLLNTLRLSRRRAPSPESLIVWETAGFLAFIAVTGVVASGPAIIPGFQFAALVSAALAADLWVARTAKPPVEHEDTEPASLGEAASLAHSPTARS